MHVQPTTLWFRFSFDFFFIVVVVVAAVIVLFHVFRFCCYLFQTEYIFFSGSLGQRHASCLQIFIWPHSNYDAPVPYFARIFSPFVFSITFHQHYYSILMVSLNGPTAYVLRLITYSLSARIYLAVILVVCVSVCVETVFVVGNSHLKIYWTIVVAVDRAFSTTTTTAREKFAHNNNNRHWHKISAKGWETSSNFEFSAL